MTFCSVTSRSAAETAALGARLGALLEKGDFVSLTGDLGGGKSQFARGVARGLAVDPSVPITSPTFTLMNVYQGRLPLYHFDLYRISGDEMGELGFAEYFYGDGVSVVEWAERLGEEVPPQRLMVHFRHAGNDIRQIDFTAAGDRYRDLLHALFRGR